MRLVDITVWALGLLCPNLSQPRIVSTYVGLQLCMCVHGGVSCWLIPHERECVVVLNSGHYYYHLVHPEKYSCVTGCWCTLGSYISILSDMCTHPLTYTHTHTHICTHSYSHTYAAGYVKKENPVLKQRCVIICVAAQFETLVNHSTRV